MTGAGEITRSALLRATRARLAAGDVAEVDADARLLLGAATGLSPLDVVTEPRAPVEARDADRLDALVMRRLAGEPVARILGHKDFWGMAFTLSPGTLEPRADSEIAVEAALEQLAPRRGEALRIADLGTGTGCLLAALLSELPAARGVGVDLDPDAAATAGANLAALGLSARALILTGSWDMASGPFDLVISNPPYIRSDEIDGLAREVRAHDPLLALDGGGDGLDAYRAICALLPARLAPDGVAVFEISHDQADAVTRIADGHGLRRIALRRDLQGHDRALVFALC
jgi:release factor glutamine methyltransferase